MNESPHPAARSAWAALNEASGPELIDTFREFGPNVSRAIAREVLRRRAAHSLPATIHGFADLVRDIRDRPRPPLWERLWRMLTRERGGCLGL